MASPPTISLPDSCHAGGHAPTGHTHAPACDKDGNEQSSPVRGTWTTFDPESGLWYTLEGTPMPSSSEDESAAAPAEHGAISAAAAALDNILPDVVAGAASETDTVRIYGS